MVSSPPNSSPAPEPGEAAGLPVAHIGGGTHEIGAFHEPGAVRLQHFRAVADAGVACGVCVRKFFGGEFHRRAALQSFYCSVRRCGVAQISLRPLNLQRRGRKRFISEKDQFHQTYGPGILGRRPCRFRRHPLEGSEIEHGADRKFENKLRALNGRIVIPGRKGPHDIGLRIDELPSFIIRRGIGIQMSIQFPGTGRAFRVVPAAGEGMQPIAAQQKRRGVIVRHRIAQIGAVLDAAQPAFGIRCGIGDAVKRLGGTIAAVGLRRGVGTRFSAVDDRRAPRRLHAFIQTLQVLRKG